MNVFLLGGGGREHALAWRLSQSPGLGKLWCAPGSDAIAEFAECVALNPLDPAAIALFARDRAIDLVVIGPEAPLAAGVSDAVEAAGVAVFGPSAAAARLETSKAFAREIADAAGAPGAEWKLFHSLDAARGETARRAPPIVVKADGLAAGKGVTVAASREEAEAALEAIFAEPGAAAVIEDFLTGEEASLFALCDGETAIAFGSAQDHKRAFDGDRGPNTGGMGAYAPAPVMTPEVEERAMDEIVRPVLAEMARRETPYRGVLYAGLMIEAGRPRLVEFNARFGDPEAQVLAMRWRGDLLSALHAAAAGRVSPELVDWSDEAALCVVLASKGYPGAYARGSEIGGLDEAAVADPHVRVFHAGTRRAGGRWIAQGGRVLNVCATGRDVAEAQARAYAVVDLIDWPGGFHRRDIGWRALGR
ncbi:MAG: phosphoribosylamine--glycine ligase [Rubrimonas sp.]|uniref:phosphoribosylamine--glycine ligase n=1 Tax=Rubrimonas sp. TaxID=2036015 RepID=UPI002FDD5133